MLCKIRIIPVLTVSDGKLVKTIQFQNPRNLNSPMAAVRLFNSRNVDEMVILFIDGKIDFELFDEISRECFMPLAVGGGIKTMEDVDRLFSLGADKVVIRTHTELCKPIAEKYGEQAVVQSLDIPRMYDFQPFVGEYLITDTRLDGMMTGYNIVIPRSDVPIIVNGGAGKPEHFLEAYNAGASALAASSIWFYTETTPTMVKQYLHEHGGTRPVTNNNMKPKLGSGARFAALKKKLAKRSGVTNPGALAAAIGRKKYGKKKFAALGTKGRKQSSQDYAKSKKMKMKAY